MDTLELYRNETKIAAYQLGVAPLEVGRASSCDLVLDAADVALRHWLVVKRRGVVALLDVSRGKRSRARELPLPSHRRFGLSEEYALKWVPCDAQVTPRGEPVTDGIARPRTCVPRWIVLTGSDPNSSKLRVDDDPVHIGRAADNEVVLVDRFVSEHHARLEPCESGLVVRDLGSRNGTFVNGVRVQMAMLSEGAHLRIGRSELRVLTVRDADEPGPTMIAESSSMLQVLSDVQRNAQLSWPVLVTGESGTGKEGIALALHEAGPRRARPFVAVNAGGLPRELIESELFGHERGAFTGAANAHKGVFEQAHGGTLFLDEIGELPPALQARLLRVLETGEIRRVGSESTKRVDVRLVCATHRNLRAMVDAGDFRQDLYFRIARLVIEVPALRARPEDLRALSRHFLQQIANEVGVVELTEDAMGLLLAHSWPGNARELRNVLCVAASGAVGQIEIEDVSRALRRVSGCEPNMDARALQSALDRHRGNLAAVARSLGVARTTLRDRMNKLNSSTPGDGAPG